MWLVVEDAAEPSLAVTRLLDRSGIAHQHLAVGPTRQGGNAQRNLALTRIRAERLRGIVYQMDDDNAYRSDRTHGALPHRAPCTRCTADRVHHVWYMCGTEQVPPLPLPHLPHRYHPSLWEELRELRPRRVGVLARATHPVHYPHPTHTVPCTFPRWRAVQCAVSSDSVHRVWHRCSPCDAR